MTLQNTLTPSVIYFINYSYYNMIYNQNQLILHTGSLQIFMIFGVAVTVTVLMFWK